MPPFIRTEPFDASRDFVCLTFFRAAGYPWEKDADFDKTIVDQRTLQLLYEAHNIGFKNYDEAQLAADLAPVTIEDAGDGSFKINAPWLETPETITGKGTAIVRAQAIRAAGEPSEHHGVAVVATGGGWYAVNALWMAAPEKIQGQDKANDRATELRAAGPPAGWVPPGTLVGSDSFESSYSIGGQVVPLGDIVASAQLASGHDANVWNAMDQSMRDELIKADIDRRQAAAAQAEAALAAEGAGAESGGAS